MTPRRLRLIIRRFGTPGVVFVAAYLGLLRLREKQRAAAIAVCLLLFLPSLLLLRRPAELPKRSLPAPQITDTPHAVPVPKHTPSDSILKRAKEVMDIKVYWDWEGGYGEYRWLSDHELLYAQYAGKGPNRIESPRLFRYDTYTHTRIELKRLMRLIGCFYHSQMEVSPNGKWILWHGGDNKRETLDAATLDGTQHLQWPGGYWTLHGLAWTGDSRHWVEFRHISSDSPRTQVILHDVLAPKTNRTLTMLTSRLWEHDVPDIIGRDRLLSVSEPERDDPQDRLHVIEASLLPGHSLARQYDILLPPTLSGPNIQEVRVSPQGDRLALVIGYDTSEDEETDRITCGLWVCHLDGSGLHELGSWQQEDLPNRFSELEALRWLPDGKRLSFVFHHTLWTVAAGETHPAKQERNIDRPE